MLLTSSPRRALGLLAVGTIGMSTAVFGVTGVAQAAPSGAEVTTDPWGFTYEYDGDTDSVTLPAGYCAVDWHLEGAQGGAGTDVGAEGGPGGVMDLVTYVEDPTVPTTYTLAPGGAGSASVLEVGGTGGVSPLDSEFDGSDGQDLDYNTEPGAAGGGGGAATVVTGDDDFLLLAYGGTGGGDENYGGLGHNSMVNRWFASTSEPPVNGVDADGGDGYISAEGILCQPDAPNVYYAEGDDGTLTVEFQQLTAGEIAIDGYEYTLDGGDHWTTLTTKEAGGSISGTISGLTNGTTYTVQVRAVGTNGAASEPSRSIQGTPVKRVPAPASVSAAVGASSLRVSWVPAADSAGTVSYEAFASPDGAQSSQDTVICTTATTTCALGVKPGIAYTFGVVGIDALGNYGRPIFGEKATELVPAVAIAATLPKADGTLTSSAADGKVAAGAQVTVSGKDFLPGSTVEIVVYSTPVKLGSVVVLADGTFTTTVTLPANLTNGVHNLVASGVDVNGNARNLVVEVTVSGGTAVLANTGFSALPFVGAGALALLAGGGLLVAARRRQAA